MHDKLLWSFKNMFTINRNMPNARTTRQSNMPNIGRCDSQSPRFVEQIDQCYIRKPFSKTDKTTGQINTF